MTWPIHVMRDEIVWVVVLGVVSFHMLVKAQPQTLLSMLVMACFGYAAFAYLQKRASIVQEKQKDDTTFLNQEIAWRKEAHNDKYFVATFPKKGLKYLRRNDALVEVAKKIVITRMFDRARYSDLLLTLDQLQKVYMYILDGRYDVKTYAPVFLDLREGALENMYSLYFVIPRTLKHVYGLDTYQRIQETIDGFSEISRDMIRVLKSYSEKTAKQPVFPLTLPSASDAPFDPLRNRRLP